MGNFRYWSSHKTKIGNISTQTPRAKPSWAGWDPEEGSTARRAAHAWGLSDMKQGSGTAPHLLSAGLCPGVCLVCFIQVKCLLSQQEQGGHHLLSTECASLTMCQVLCMHFFILVAILWSRQQPQEDCKPAEKFREEPKKESISGETGVAKGRTYYQRRGYNFHVFHHSNGLKV